MKVMHQFYKNPLGKNFLEYNYLHYSTIPGYNSLNFKPNKEHPHHGLLIGDQSKQLFFCAKDKRSEAVNFCTPTVVQNID